MVDIGIAARLKIRSNRTLNPGKELIGCVLKTGLLNQGCPSQKTLAVVDALPNELPA